jgi:hypothetical protein
MEVAAKCAGMNTATPDSSGLVPKADFHKFVSGGKKCSYTSRLLGKPVRFNWNQATSMDGKPYTDYDTLEVAYKEPNGAVTYEILWVVSETVLPKK